ncbi:MAG: polysaccharide biosynthesis tyrosine autokinase [Acutalibacteraceae bacterium]|nr:polysaccharide biosynthesis tyrosine autokinase [Acutalibacteraceae bacterium]
MNNGDNKIKNENKNYSFDMNSTIKDIIRHWYIILLVAIIASMGCFVFAKQTYKPQYSTHITLLVQSKTSGQSTYDSLSTTTKIANVFKSILDSSQLQNTAAELLGYNSFPGTLSCSVVEETNILSFTVTSDSPMKSYRLLNAVLESYPKFTKNVFSTVVLQTLEEPVVPVSPINSLSAYKMMILGFIIGAFGTIALIVVLSYFKDTVKKENEVEKKLNIKRIVSIPRQKKKMKISERIKGVRKSLSLANPVIGFAFRESFKKLRRIVVSDSEKHNHKIYAITSSLENEGKTTVAVNLAIALGKMDYKVLLIDSDLRKPAVIKFLDKTVEEGKCITDFLEGKARLSDILTYDDILNITIVGCDKGTAKANELIASDEMNYLLSVGKEKYDFVIIDTPPLGFVADAEDIISESDASVLVVRRDVANAITINDTIDIILGTHTKLLGCVYNDAENVSLTGSFAYGKYGYGYGYEYGKYSNHKD